MEGILRVTPEKLLQASEEFAGLGSQMKSLTGEMISMVRDLGGSWLGEAASAYGRKFDSLQPDMDKLSRMVQEHVQDLQEMAREYKAAESGNLEQGSGMQSNIIL